MSGNGTRCAAAYLLARAGGDRASTTVETAAGVSGHFLESREGRRSAVSSRILAPRFRPSDVPVLVDGEEAIDVEMSLSSGPVRVSCVNIGNPQAVVFEGWDEESWPRIGREIERHELFPQRTNVDFARVTARDRIEVRLWERGVGPVEASGTGASGAFSTARRKGLVDGRVEAVMEGGTLEIEEREDGLLLKGWCEEVFEGTIDVAPARGEVR
jgi:diaminopimelate epimerase